MASAERNDFQQKWQLTLKEMGSTSGMVSTKMNGFH